MYKYVSEILPELGIRPSSKQKSSRCFSIDQKETVKSSLDPNDKQLKSYILTKLNQIKSEKQIILAKKRKALLWYKMIVNNMLNPLIEYLPSVTNPFHLSKLADFRANEGGFSGQYEGTNRQMIIVRPKCVEEPIPIIIKPEYKVKKNRKKSSKIVKKLIKARDTKNEMVNKYRNWKNKTEKESEDQKKWMRKQGLLVYELFLKDSIESKIEDLMPSIKAKNEFANAYDFRFQNETEVEHESHEEFVASSREVSNCNPHKGHNRNKTVITKSLNMINASKMNPISAKTKPNNILSPTKEESVHTLKNPATTFLNDEIQNKSQKQRLLHNQNWASNNRMNFIKVETAKDKPVMKKTGLAAKIKNTEIIQPLINSTLNVENKGKNPPGYTKQLAEEKEAEMEVSSRYVTADKPAAFSEVLSKENLDPLQVENITKPNKITENLRKMQNIANKENIMNIVSHGNGKLESAFDLSLEQSDTQCDLKTNFAIDEPIIADVNLTPEADNSFVQERNLEKNGSQTENTMSTIQGMTGKVAKLSETELLAGLNPSSILTLKSEENKAISSDSKTLQQTYLVSFEVKEDEAFLKTRSQVIGDTIKGDLIDLNVVLKEEKKVREGQRNETTAETCERTSDGISSLLNNNKSEFQNQCETILPKSDDKNKVDEKINLFSATNQDVSRDLPPNKLIKSKISNSKLNLPLYSKQDGHNLKDNLHDKSGKKASGNVVKKRSQSNQEKHMKDDTSKGRKEGQILSELNAEYKKSLIKTHSIEVMGREKKEKLPKHTKFIEKRRNIWSSTPDRRIKGSNKIKELDKKEQYQEIINSVKKIIPSAHSNESMLEINTHKTTPSNTKMNHKNSVTKNYSKTINELKEIISELPESRGQPTVCAVKYSREENSKANKTSETVKPEGKTPEEEKVVSNDDILDNNQRRIKGNNTVKRINLKTIKVMDKIMNEGLEPLNTIADKTNDKLSIRDSKGEKDLNSSFETSKYRISSNKVGLSIENNKLGVQTKSKESIGNNNSNLNLKIKINNPQRQGSFKQLHRQAETSVNKEGIIPESGPKAKRINDTKFNERYLEENKELKIFDNASKSNKSEDIMAKRNTAGLKNTTIKTRGKSLGDNTSITLKNQRLARSKSFAKPAETEKHETSENPKVGSYAGKLNKSQILLSGEANREKRKVNVEKSEMDVNETDNDIIKEFKINTTSESKRNTSTNSKDASHFDKPTKSTKFFSSKGNREKRKVNVEKSEMEVNKIEGSEIKELKTSASTENRQDTSENSKETSYVEKPTNDKILFGGERSREKRKIKAEKKEMDINKTETNQFKELQTKTSSVNKKSSPSITGTGTLVRKIKNKITEGLRENKLKDQITATDTENNPIISTTTDNNISSDNSHEMSMEKFVTREKNSLLNQRKEIKLTLSREAKLKSGSDEKDKIYTQSDDTVKGKPIAEIIDSQNLTHTTASRGSETIVETKLKKKTQPTGIFTKKTLKVKVKSNVKPERNVQSSKSRSEGSTVILGDVKSKIQEHSEHTKGHGILKVNRRLENR